MTETYNIVATKIYRTTAWISESGTVYGSGDVLGTVYKNDTVWKGSASGGSAVSNVLLETSQDKWNNFTVDGDIVFGENLITLKAVI